MARETKRETTAQAARRYAIKTSTMWRRCEIARQGGHVTLSDDDTVGGKLYLPRATWDLICRVTPAPGRPKKSPVSG